MTVDPEPMLDAEDVIGKVKSAIKAANLSTSESTTDVFIVEVVVTLKVVRDLEAGGEARWKVPVIGLELGAHKGRKWSTSNIIELTLTPPRPAAGEAQSLVPTVDLESDLPRAIRMVRATVVAAARDEPVFELRESTVEIAFGVTVTGGLSLVAKAEATADTTNTLKLTLSGPQRPLSGASNPAPGD